MGPDVTPNLATEVDPARGLTAAQVADRVAAGRTNQVPDAPVRTLPQILRANVFSPVNGIMLALFAAILVAGFPRDGLFVGVVVSNAIIGVAQEIRAKRELDRLAVLSAPKARVVREWGSIRSRSQRSSRRRCLRPWPRRPGCGGWRRDHLLRTGSRRVSPYR